MDVQVLFPESFLAKDHVGFQDVIFSGVLADVETDLIEAAFRGRFHGKIERGRRNVFKRDGPSLRDIISKIALTVNAPIRVNQVAAYDHHPQIALYRKILLNVCRIVGFQILGKLFRAADEEDALPWDDPRGVFATKGKRNRSLSVPKGLVHNRF